MLILEPSELEQDLKWYEMTDSEAVQLGLRFGVMDDESRNPNGELSRSRGAASFHVPLLASEIEALRQVERAAQGLQRRANLEADAMGAGRGATLPFFFGGFGQGGVVALYCAVCLMDGRVGS